MVAATPIAMNTTKYVPIGDCAKACTELTTPDRVRNVPKMHRKKVAEISTMFQIFIMPFFSCIITECRNAVAVIHGSSDAFSTGSQAQYPPHPSTAYAQPCPSRMPVLWKSHVTMVHRRVVCIHESPGCLVINDAIANANGTVNPTYPRYSIGGWITIVQYCSSGFRPRPIPSTILPRPATKIWNGLNTNAIRIRKNVSVDISTAVTHGIMSRNFRRFMNTTTAEY